MRQPSVYLLAAIWAGLLTGGVMGRCLFAWLVILLAHLACIWLVPKRRARFALVVSACCLVGVLRSPESRWNATPVPEAAAGRVKPPVVLDVRTPFLAADCSQRVTATVEQVLAGPAWLEGRGVVLRGLDHLRPRGSSCFRVCGRFAQPQPRLNPFGPDAVKHYCRMGAVGAVDVTAVRTAGSGGFGAVVSRFRERLERLIREACPGEASGMLEAMLLGQRSELTPHVQTVMLKAGTYHVIAVSGLHVGIVLIVMAAFLSILGLPRAVLAAAYVASVTLYVVFTGSPPSAVRAAGLFLVVGLARVLQWKVDLPNCVCATGALLLLVFPRFAWEIGFQLSLAAVLGMGLFAVRGGAGGRDSPGVGRRLARHAWTCLAVSIAAEALTLPIVLHDFGRASLVAPLGNLVMVPLTTLAIAAGMEASVALVFSSRLARVLMKAAATVTQASIAATELVTRPPWALLYSGQPGPARLVPYCAGVVFLGFMCPRMRKGVKLLLLVILHGLLVVPAPGSSDHLLSATFLYVGDGDATVLEMPGGEKVLVDAGPDVEARGRAQSPVVSFLAMRGINRLDKVVVTHAHDDHYGGVVSLLENLPVGEILVGSVEGEAGYRLMLERARAKGVRVRIIAAGDAWHSGPADVKVLHPQVGDADRFCEDENARSVVLRVSLGDVALLLTGDLTPEMGRALAEGWNGAEGIPRNDVPAADLACTVLKAPHHGAPNSLDPAFLDACGASVAVVSVGSRFASHPWPATLAMLEASGASTFITSRDGAVSVVTDGRGVDVRSESGRSLTLAKRQGPS